MSETQVKPHESRLCVDCKFFSEGYHDCCTNPKCCVEAVNKIRGKVHVVTARTMTCGLKGIHWERKAPWWRFTW